MVNELVVRLGINAPEPSPPAAPECQIRTRFPPLEPLPKTAVDATFLNSTMVAEPSISVRLCLD